MTLHITISDYNALRHHAEAIYPEECCGVVIGRLIADERHAHGIVACRNVHAGNAHTRYELDPVELVRVQREARESGFEIIGFYHSHPDHPAQPSPTDLEHAHWIGCSYVITAVENGKATQTRSFLLSGTREEDKRFGEEEIIIHRLDSA